MTKPMDTKLAKYHFRDELGHPLENCVDFISLLDEIDALRSENAQLRESKSVVKRVMCQTGVEKEFGQGAKEGK